MLPANQIQGKCTQGCALRQSDPREMYTEMCSTTIRSKVNVQRDVLSANQNQVNVHRDVLPANQIQGKCTQGCALRQSDPR